MLFLPAMSFGQDRIVKNDGSVIESKVIEISDAFVKYTSYTNQGGPVYTLSKDKIFSIVYENGQSEQLSSPEGWSLDSTNEGKLELRAGTEIPIRIVSPVKAADVKVGQTVSFKLSRDIVVNGVTLLPYGTAVKGVVYEAKKSSWWGTKGRLGIRIDNISMPNGAQIPLSDGNVYVTGTNRTALSVLLFCFVCIPACAICGSRAEIPAGYEIMASVAETVSFVKQGNTYSILRQ